CSQRTGFEISPMAAIFFFSSRRRHTRFSRDWSSDVCSSDLIAARVADSPPERAEPFERIFADFENIVPPGMTHWQHPRFFAYFPSNAAPPALIAEQLAAAMSAQGMLWQTSPALTELEQRMVDWLRQAVGLPAGFSGVLQDTASTT